MIKHEMLAESPGDGSCTDLELIEGSKNKADTVTGLP